MVDSLYYSSRKIPERCENSFVNYRIYYQKLCDLMRQITKEMNWPSGPYKAQERIHFTDAWSQTKEIIPVVFPIQSI